MRFTSACLTIDEVCSIVTVQYVHDKWQGRLLEYLQLRRIRSEDRPKHKVVLSCLFRPNVKCQHLALVWSEFDTSNAIRVVLLALQVAIIAIQEGV